MQNESPNNSNKNSSSKSINHERENIICKDGFCSISNNKEASIVDKNDLNIFDPI
tara:strand:+ start:150 stop:314 length:165 start_codon:yes stop_codon:yes gene_type:complete